MPVDICLCPLFGSIKMEGQLWGIEETLVRAWDKVQISYCSRKDGQLSVHIEVGLAELSHALITLLLPDPFNSLDYVWQHFPLALLLWHWQLLLTLLIPPYLMDLKSLKCLRSQILNIFSISAVVLKLCHAVQCL